MSATFPLLPTLDLDAIICCADNGGGKSAGKNSKSAKKAKRSSARSLRRVAIFGTARELTLYRAEVLRLRGFSVVVAGDRRVGEELIRHRLFDIAVFSYTLPNDLVKDLAELLREHSPGSPVIAIANKPVSDPVINPDAVVRADDGPEALVNAIRKLSRPN